MDNLATTLVGLLGLAFACRDMKLGTAIRCAQALKPEQDDMWDFWREFGSTLMDIARDAEFNRL